MLQRFLRELIGKVFKVGENHLKITVKQGNSPVVDCIGFGLAEYESLLIPGQTFSMCYTVEDNVWKDQHRIQLNIKAINTDQ